MLDSRNKYDVVNMSGNRNKYDVVNMSGNRNKYDVVNMSGNRNKHHLAVLDLPFRPCFINFQRIHLTYTL